MNIVARLWQKICLPLDSFLWHRNISHPVIRPVLRNEILATACCLFFGAVFWFKSAWLFWFGCGLACMTWIFWSWAKFFLNHKFGEYSSAIFRTVLLRFGGRFLFLGLALYFILAVCKAPAAAILAGLTAGVVLAMLGFALNMRPSQ